jgi:hypothetical protein
MRQQLVKFRMMQINSLRTAGNAGDAAIASYLAHRGAVLARLTGCDLKGKRSRESRRSGFLHDRVKIYARALRLPVRVPAFQMAIPGTYVPMIFFASG